MNPISKRHSTHAQACNNKKDQKLARLITVIYLIKFYFLKIIKNILLRKARIVTIQQEW